MCRPVSMTFLFVCVSIKLMEDRQRGSKGEAWIKYTRAVPSPLLLVPPPINRRLGQWLHAAESGEAGSTSAAVVDAAESDEAGSKNRRR